MELTGYTGQTAARIDREKLGKELLLETQKFIDAENSDLFEVLAHVAYALPSITREARATWSKVRIHAHFNIDLVESSARQIDFK